jgi:hypothetical protein
VSPSTGHADPASTLSRRAFLRRVGVGAATVLVVVDGLLAYRAYDQGVLAEGQGPDADPGHGDLDPHRPNPEGTP